ncbi:MAG: tRNA1(Val) (adenine(37)-N6)-methyltransferase [Thermodesulfobacteriota bacterium]|nr:tRNA1(Val) (adenine(37)-N6)-methyltransferase [Thermodesulfobacteriota bacterium]
MPDTSPPTADRFFNGRIHVNQPPDGYRFSLDAPLLAAHVSPAPGARVVDLGTGCGIIPLLLAHRHSSIFIAGVELQARLANLAGENVRANNMEDRIGIARADINTLGHGQTAGRVDLVICNPPFRKAGDGRVNPDPERAVARHEVTITLEGIIAAAKRLLRVAGEFAIIYPAVRVIDLVTAMRAAAIEPKRLRMVHSRQTDTAKLVIVKGIKNGRPGATIEPPLVIYEAAGRQYTPEAESMMQSKF